MSAGKHLTVLVLAVAALAAALALPAAASATVYCVDTTPAELADNDAIDPSCETPAETLATAAAAAAASTTEGDTVLIGPGDYTLPDNPGGSEVNYFSPLAANTLVVRGLGEPHLTLGGTGGMQNGIWLNAPAGSRIEDLRLTVPANVDTSGDTAIVLVGGAVAEGVTVDGPEAENALGLKLYGGTAVSASLVDLPIEAAHGNTGVIATAAGPVAVSDSTLRATYGVTVGGSTTTIERSTIEARIGANTDSGTIVVRDSLIDLGNRSGAIGIKLANENNGGVAMHGAIEGTTIVGGGSSSAGIRVQADSGTESADAAVDSTVIAGPVYPLQVWADNGRDATLAASYSNYGSNLSLKADKDGSGETGTIEYTPTEVTDLEPGFVNAAAGNYHLAPGSPLADLGDPASPPAEELDIDGDPRALAATCPGGAGRRDIGADEIAPACAEPEAEPEPEPEGEGEPQGAGSEGTGSGPGAQPSESALPPNTRIRGKRRVVTAKRRVRVTFRISASEAGTRFRCKVDRMHFRRCGAVFSVFLKRGRHRIAAKAIGPGGADPTPAVRIVRIVEKKAAARPTAA